MIILSRQQEQVEFINKALRKAGHAVHCHWVTELNDLGDTLMQINAHMVIGVMGEDSNEMLQALKVFRQFAPNIPALIVREQITEAVIAQAMQQGARDVVSLTHVQRLQWVVTRELNAFRQERKLASTIASAQEYREQLKSFMSGSADAIAHMQDGIIVDANPAWLDLFGYKDQDDLVGQPLMDCFDPESHTAFKGAIAACLQGKWSDHDLKVNALLPDGSTLPVGLQLQAVDMEGERAVQIRVPSQKKDSRGLNEQLNDALQRDASTSFLQRRFFIERLRAALKTPIKAGIRELLCIQPDKFDALADELGADKIEDFVAQFAGILKEHLQPGDMAGRFGDCQIFVVMERGTRSDIDAWCGSIISKVARHVFNVEEKSVTCSCTIGAGVINPQNTDINTLIKDAAQGLQQAQQKGGNQSQTIDRIDDDTKRVETDKMWVRMIKAALMDNRFRLLQQPIASLSGEDTGMCDVLVRMIDEHSNEILPSEFLAAAERNDLMKNIDRWVIGSAMQFCSSRKIKQLFVRLSKDSVLDRSLPKWLESQLAASRVSPERIVFEINEKIATEYLKNTVELSRLLHATGFKFALEHAGNARDPKSLLQHLQLDYLKFDGALMQGLSLDIALQERIQELVNAARERKIRTIAERVEDANTLAVLWQLGLELIQGYFVHEPEQVVLG
jgi:diguanylate cyclase (GGDEF)-like protein/PAS domain S-box-containing protein